MLQKTRGDGGNPLPKWEKGEEEKNKKGGRGEIVVKKTNNRCHGLRKKRRNGLLNTRGIKNPITERGKKMRTRLDYKTKRAVSPTTAKEPIA